MAVYACDDSHGQGWAWDAIKNRLAPSDYLYFLGDAVDGGLTELELCRRYLIGPILLTYKATMSR